MVDLHNAYQEFRQPTCCKFATMRNGQFPNYPSTLQKRPAIMAVFHFLSSTKCYQMEFGNFSKSEPSNNNTSKPTEINSQKNEKLPSGENRKDGECVNTEQKLTAVDLFAGAGGFSLAAINSGINVLGAIELDETACETYKNNISKRLDGNPVVLNENIFEVDPFEFREKLSIRKNELDILLGGPPCQGFSSHRINNSGVEDPRNKLLIRYFDFVKELGPKVFLVENVPGLLWERHSDYLKKFIALARRHGYSVLKPIKINAKDYGVPQNRSRVFILGIRTDINQQHLVWPPLPTYFKDEKKGRMWNSASSVFPKPPEWVLNELSQQIGRAAVEALQYGEDVNSADIDSSAISMQHSKELIDRFSNTPINGSRLDGNFRLPCHDKDYNGHKDVYGRIRLAQPGPTVTTGCFNPSKGRFLHPWLNQGIALRYAARLQTFPDQFYFCGGITSQAKQIGNAVPIMLGESLLSALSAFLKKVL